MTATFTASFLGATFGNNKSLATIFNGSGSALIVRIYRIIILNNQTVAVANGVLTTMELRRITASTGGTAGLALKHDTNTTDLASEIAVVTGATDTVSSNVYKRFLWSTDEPAATVATIDEWQCIPIFNTVWSSGYGETEIEPIILREGEGLAIKQPGANTLGSCDIFIEFTVAAS
jgi:hypothetical protein